MRRWLSRIHDFFFPHERNGYRPHFFSWRSIVGVTAVVLFFSVAYFAVTTVIFHRTNFLSAVLPGVLTSLTNEDRAHNGIGGLTENPLLDQAAAKKADDMAANGYFAHVSPSGKTPWYWLDQVGYDYTYAGENLAVNFTDSQDVETAWMNSPTHRANILKGDYTEIGIGTAQGMYEGKETTFVVQFFGTPAGAATAVSGSQPAKTAAVNPAPSGTDASATVPADQLATSGKPPSDNVLGAEAPAPAPAAAPSGIAPSVAATVATAATSPNHLLAYVIGAICALTLAVLFMALFFHKNTRHLEVVGGGVLILVIALGSLFFTATHAADLQIPQAATSSVASR